VHFCREPGVIAARCIPVEHYRKQLRVKREKNYCSNAEYVFTSLEDAQKSAEAFIHKEVMLYKVSLLEEDHAERVLAVV
jgi:hypothetical protein